MEIKTYDEIYNDMCAYIIANQKLLSDFNVGGVLASQVEATAREIALLYIACRVGFSSYLRALPYSVFGFPPHEGTRASAGVVFSRDVPGAEAIAIPSGVTVSGDGCEFVTTKAGEIQAGSRTSEEIPALAKDTGEKYNLRAGSISAIVSGVPSLITGVTNNNPATGGEGTESWDAFTKRFSDYIVGLQRTNESGLRTAVSKYARSLAYKEHFPPKDNIWNITICLEDGSGSMSDEKIQKAKKIIDGNDKEGGYRVPGINIDYTRPAIITVDINIDVTIVENIGRADLDIKEQITKAITEFVNKRTIGMSLKLVDLSCALNHIPIVDNLKINAPTEDVLVGWDEIIRCGEITLGLEYQ